jgi:cell division protein FtsB
MSKKKFFKRFRIPEKMKPYVYNRYTLTLLGALVWMTFFDKHDFILEHTYRQKLHDLQKELTYYETEIVKNRELTTELFTNPKNLERFAREKYFMKRDNEDVFVFVKEAPLPQKGE